MFWIVLLIASPFLVWLWLGVSFTIIDFSLYWLAKQESTMITTVHEERARIIRYTELNEPSMPGLLSFFDQEKNILHIDRDLAETLPKLDRERLEVTHLTFTRKAGSGETGLRFKPYVTTEVTMAAQ